MSASVEDDILKLCSKVFSDPSVIKELSTWELRMLEDSKVVHKAAAAYSFGYVNPEYVTTFTKAIQLAHELTKLIDTMPRKYVEKAKIKRKKPATSSSSSSSAAKPRPKKAKKTKAEEDTLDGMVMMSHHTGDKPAKPTKKKNGMLGAHAKKKAKAVMAGQDADGIYMNEEDM